MILPEIVKAAEGSFIKNVYQYRDTFVLKLYQPTGGTYHLLIQPGTRIHLTEFRRVAPRVPPKFCTVLRKYLRDRRIHSIKQHDLDRIVVLEVGDEESSYKLVAELFGQGNLLLLDPEDTIFVAMRYRKMRDRDVMPKATYIFPPPRGTDVFTLEADQLDDLILSSNANIVRTLTSRLNLDSSSCEEICALSGISPSAKASEIDEQAMKDLRSGVDKFTQKLLQGIEEPKIVFSEDYDEEEYEPEAFLPFKFTIYDDLPSKTFDSFSITLDEFYGVSDDELEDTVQLDAKAKERKRLQTIIDRQQESITRLQEKGAELRVAGEMIYAHFQVVTEVLETVTHARAEGFSWDEIIKRIEEGKQQNIESALMIQQIIPSQAQIVVKLNDTDVKLDIRISTQDNASQAYDQAKKSESKVIGAKKQIEKTEEKLQKIEEIEIVPDTEQRAIKFRKRKWYEKFRWFTSSDGHLVLGGRDAKTNERLAKRHMGPNDVFLHASVHGAPYVLIKVPVSMPGEQTLQEAAEFAVTFSRAWQDGLTSGDAYWVNPEQVSFTPPTGEYLPSGAVMIYGTKNYIRNVSVNLLVGVILEEDIAIPVSGPSSAIQNLTEYCVRVIPGQQKKGQLVKEILNSLKRIVPDDKIPLLDQMPQEDMMRVLPPGEGKLVIE